MSDVFITENFLLQSPSAVRLYHDYARDLPIIDYHCHLPPAQVAADCRFANLTQIWLAGDHYKWRAMRAAGVPERYCTGDASDWEKFERWAQTVPQTLRNPLYHWTHLELKRPLGVSDRLLSPATAKGIWDECNARLASPGFSCRGIMQQMKVALVCTTDDPIDSLEHHAAIARDKLFPVQVLPTYRPDKGLAVDSPAAFNAWVDKLEAAANATIRDFDAYRAALQSRQEHFHRHGCRLSDHGLDTFFAADCSEAEAAAIFARVRGGQTPSADEALKFKSAMLYEFARLDYQFGWTQQFHLGAQRNNNSRTFQALGPDVGFDSIGDWPVAQAAARFFDRLDRENRLTRTIVYNLNPVQNEVLATMIGNFQDGETAGKMQFGSGWWFLDQKHGMEQQMESLSNQGLLSRFVGMLTDSRSFLSYTRHEYFRRILCNLLGSEMEQGILPRDMGLVGGLVRNVCYGNAAAYFGFNVPQLPTA